jgi:hypothetical protein
LLILTVPSVGGFFRQEREVWFDGQRLILSGPLGVLAFDGSPMRP